jgi:hypothetical protein
VLLSFWYLAFRCVLQLVLLRPRSTEFKELEIVVLGRRLAVLRRQAADKERPCLPGCCELAVAAIALAVVSGHADDAAALAATAGRAPLHPTVVETAGRAGVRCLGTGVALVGCP